MDRTLASEASNLGSTPSGHTSGEHLCYFINRDDCGYGSDVMMKLTNDKYYSKNFCVNIT